jgi:alkyldihydroxyacetonephosphate synthase
MLDAPSGLLATDAETLEAFARDRSALSLLRPLEELPAAVARPSTTDEVAALLRWADESRTPVVPRGLGSGVCGGAAAVGGSVVLDLSRLDRIVEIDEESRTVTVEAGVRGSDLERELEQHGLTTGHYPQSLAISSVGGWIATGSAGQASAGYGAIEYLVQGLTAVLADGTLVELRPVPRSDAGPDLRRLFVGSEGTLGVVTEAVLACAPRPREWKWQAYAPVSFADVIALARDVRGAFIVRGYDAVDAGMNFGREGCVLLVGFAEHAGEPLGAPTLDASLGEHWWTRRNDPVDLYEGVMGPTRVWGQGVVVDSLETAAPWRALPALYERVRAALAGRAELVACHLSHVYRSGASLYFTFLVRGEDDDAAVRAYLAAWDDAVAACHETGGTLTHHHGVGRLKARFLERELGAGGLELLRRVKRALDPNGILNPGALLP